MNKLTTVLFGLIFFVVGLVTLPHYGINWDTINHLPRGQAYLHYFLTGNKDYSDLPEFFKEWQKEGQWYWQKEDTLFFQPDIPREDVPRISLYQGTGLNFGYFVENDGGHPPISDILSSFFNYILFQKLGLVNDIDAYRIYGVLLAAVLVGLIFWWTAGHYGKFAGAIAAISLATYPLFWSESHFNTEKDIPEAVYWSFFLFAIWRGTVQKSWKWLLASGIFFGLALGTKFNILFAGMVIVPWLVISARQVISKKWFVISAAAAILLGGTIFVGSWPYLWADPLARIQNVANFYTDIGFTDNPIAGFIGPFDTNLYPLAAISVTTPLVILGLASVGLFQAIKKAVDGDKFSFLVILWLAVPIGRVVWPGMTIYGGLRQIMEYIPAMAILAGIGAGEILASCPKRLRLALAGAVLLPFAFLISTLVRIHPNENVYFNPLIGGLSGAREKDFPFWGNSFGASYRQGATWLNENVAPGGKIAYAHELIPNIPRIWLRTDVTLHNSQRSGYLRRGEYTITLPYQGTEDRSYYDMYLTKFIAPVYEAKVDGVPVVTIWKNDVEHLKVPWQEEEDNIVLLTKKQDGLSFDLGEVRNISRLEIDYNESQCPELESGFVRISADGQTWERLPEVLPDAWRVAALGKQPVDGHFIEPFVGQEARFVELVLSPTNTCLKNVVDFQFYYLHEN